MNFFLGCAIWAYKEWIGELYPSGSRAADLLHLYSRRFTAVEGNTTFYSIPDQATVQRWARETPAEFQFCLKLPRDVTHRGLLNPELPKAIAFLDQMQGLGDRLGPCFAQLPPGYSAAYLEDLHRFLRGWPRDRARLALEVRHGDWFEKPHLGTLNAILQDLGMARVLLDSRPIYECPDDPQVHSERRKPNLPVLRVKTTDFTIIRYISHPQQRWNDPYLQEWITQVKDWVGQGTQIYFFVHCPVEGRSPSNARYFQTLLEEQQVPIPSLPWNTLEHPPVQLGLF